jgi:MFS family permease
MYGYDSAFIGGTLSLPSFQTSFGLTTATTTNLSSNIVSTFQAGAFFGAILGFFLAERFGRKLVIILFGLVFIVGVIIQLIGHLGMLYAGRALTGLTIGCTSMIIPIYISECSPAQIRGRMVGMFEIMLQIALVFGFWVNYGVQKNISGTDSKQWRIPVGIQLIPVGLLLTFMPFMIESPRWLASKNRNELALKNLAWVRNLPEDHPYLLREMADIQAGVEHELQLVNGSRGAFQMLRECGAPGIRNRIIISVMLMLLQNLTGYVFPFGALLNQSNRHIESTPSTTIPPPSSSPLASPVPLCSSLPPVSTVLSKWRRQWSSWSSSSTNSEDVPPCLSVPSALL